MDFNLKQWKDQQHELEEEERQQTSSTKLPRLLLNSHPQQPPGPGTAVSLLVPNPTGIYSSDSTTPSANKPPWMGSYFSLAQWQELELQAVIFKHMIAGAAVPSELLHHVNKSLINSSSPPYYQSHHHYYSHYQPGLLQSGYWGKWAMDREPGRCRRTDGKKWRCSRDVVAGQKYCERHVHRGRNRSRKPVEIPTSTTTPYSGKAGSNGCLEVLKTTNAVARAATGGGGTVPFSLSGPSPSMDLLHFNQRPSESIIETKGPFEAQDNVEPGGRTLRRFFDDWPRSLQETDNATSSAASATNLSISMETGNPSSDFSLKLSTGYDGDDSGPQVINGPRDRLQLNWAAPWGTNQVAPMGGPLAEALRSSTSNSSPTSVLHQLPPRGSALVPE
ncbi:growth-regulating factor 3-like isoform X1 [Olea europaea var. sylvestris]|uniref:growth-regulating factor 3-like isoform X1 n=1 Tax=Olea europaea var. sylvestris TaxID=158386 RepID=UPI000C1D127B|nr:growth-regulating factor 3-like isoform X1 [Olea europaea var. sylvestris]